MSPLEIFIIFILVAGMGMGVGWLQPVLERREWERHKND